MTTFEKISKAAYLSFINPKLFLKYFISQARRITPQWKDFKPKSNLKRIDGIIFEIDFDYLGWYKYAKQMYFDCYEIAMVEMMRKILKPGDTFIDVGANIGYLSAIGTSLVRQEGQVHSFEPVPQSFQRLKKLAEMNLDYKIILNNCALGEKSGITKMDFAKPPHSGGSTLIPNFLTDIPKEIITVPTIRLDDYIRKNNLKKIALIKIDVEGFEFPVLKGLQNYFEKVNRKPIIICEIVPSACPLLGYTLTQLLEYMKKYGYEAYNIMNPKLKVDITKLKEGIGADVVFKSQTQ